MRKPSQVLFLASLTVVLGMTATAGRAAPLPEARQWQKRWVYVSSNLYVDENLAKLERLLSRAKDAGYNGILFADYKTFTWWELDRPERWKANARKLREITKTLGLELTVCVFPFGRAGSLLWHDVNLASGMPVKGAVLTAHDGRLVPEQTAVIGNGSFEEYRNHRAAGFSFQDAAGRGSFIDTRTAKHGRASLRFRNVGKVSRHGHGRICQRVRVQPWQQYRLRAWMKTKRLTAGQVQLLVIGGKRTLQYQHPLAAEGERLRHVYGAQELTTDWVEQSVTFNSLSNTSVNVYAGIWGGKEGSIWWDHLRIDAVPTLNLLRRGSLPLSLTGEDGTVYKEGVDFDPIVDKGLGAKPWPGSYDTRHEPPDIRLTPTSRIREGQRVRLSCYHCVIIYGGQVNCSMDHPAVFGLCEQQIGRVNEALAPDGTFMSHDEIRCAGWEPGEVSRFETSGDLLAFNVRRCFDIARRGGEGRPVYVWSDMFDPHHNARAGYYLVNGTLAGSWEGLNPRVIVMKWGGGKRARPGLQFFADRGHRQMIAAYYDSDVGANHRMWAEAAEGIPGIIGVMYTTWRDDYDKLEEFAEAWWGTDNGTKAGHPLRAGAHYGPVKTQGKQKQE